MQNIPAPCVTIRHPAGWPCAIKKIAATRAKNQTTEFPGRQARSAGSRWSHRLVAAEWRKASLVQLLAAGETLTPDPGRSRVPSTRGAGRSRCPARASPRRRSGGWRTSGRSSAGRSRASADQRAGRGMDDGRPKAPTQLRALAIRDARTPPFRGGRPRKRPHVPALIPARVPVITPQGPPGPPRRA
jgi:hypothetical protein